MPQPERTAEEVIAGWLRDNTFARQRDAAAGYCAREILSELRDAGYVVTPKPQPPGPTDALRWACEAGALLDGAHGQDGAAGGLGGLTRGYPTTVSPDDAGPDFVGSLG